MPATPASDQSPPPPAPPTPAGPPAPGLRAGRLALGAVLAVGAAVRLWHAGTEHGLYWPDEVYQSLEPAHVLVHGYGFRAWEFLEGARNWALPGAVAAVLALLRALGVEAPEVALVAARGLFALCGAGAAWGAARLARAHGAGPVPAAAAAALFALSALPLYFGHRAMSENAAALPAVWGLALALEPGARGWRLWAGASLLGLAVLLRLQLGLLAAGLPLVLLARRTPRAAAEALGVLAGWALVHGLLDRLTWGGWFHSTRVYLEFNVLKDGASGWGTAPFAYYGDTLWAGMPGVVAVGGALALVGAWRARGLALLALAFWLAHALQPHKELRFLLPALPLLAALAGVGLEAVARALPPSPVRAGLLLAPFLVAAASGARARGLTFREVGQYLDSQPQASAWGDAAALNRLLLRAHREPALCGLKLELAHPAWSGGYSYLHRRVPLFGHFGPQRGSGAFNYVVTAPGWAAGAHVVAADGGLVLARVAEGCTSDGGFTWRLP